MSCCTGLNAGCVQYLYIVASYNIFFFEILRHTSNKFPVLVKRVSGLGQHHTMCTLENNHCLTATVYV